MAFFVLFFLSSFVLSSVDTDCHFYVFEKVVECVLNRDFVFNCIFEPLIERVYLGVFGTVESCYDSLEFYCVYCSCSFLFKLR